jgi:xylose isomerase
MQRIRSIFKNNERGNFMAQWSTRDDFKFSVGPWNLHPGADPFGPPVRDERELRREIQVFKELGFDYVQFHDDDAVPDEASAERTRAHRRRHQESCWTTTASKPSSPRRACGKTRAASTARHQQQRQRPPVGLERGKRCVDVARLLGTDKMVWWPAREGTYIRESKDAVTSFGYMLDWVNALLDYDKELKILGEMKPNEPMDLMYLPTTGPLSALAYKTADPSRVGVLIESAHAISLASTRAKSSPMPLSTTSVGRAPQRPERFEIRPGQSLWRG